MWFLETPSQIWICSGPDLAGPNQSLSNLFRRLQKLMRFLKTQSRFGCSKGWQSFLTLGTKSMRMMGSLKTHWIVIGSGFLETQSRSRCSTEGSKRDWLLRCDLGCSLGAVLSGRAVGGVLWECALASTLLHVSLKMLGLLAWAVHYHQWFLKLACLPANTHNYLKRNLAPLETCSFSRGCCQLLRNVSCVG